MNAALQIRHLCDIGRNNIVLWEDFDNNISRDRFILIKINEQFPDSILVQDMLLLEVNEPLCQNWAVGVLIII